MSFETDKQKLLNQHHNHIFNSNSPAYVATPDETILDRILRKLVEEDEIDPSFNFLKEFQKYESSELVQLLKRMPKGGHLHLHSIATGSFRKLASFLLKQKDLYVWNIDVSSQDDEISKKFGDANLYGTLKYFSKADLTSLSQDERKCWAHVTNFSQEELYSLLTLPYDFKTKEQKKEFLKNRWTYFQTCWNRVFNIMHAKPLYDGKDSFLWTILSDQLSYGVTYIEFRQTACSFDVSKSVFISDAKDGYKQMSIKDHILMFSNTVKLFKQEHPEFIGAKLIFCSFKAQTNEDVHEAVQAVVKLKSEPIEVSSVVAGFDLVGHEDGLRPIEEYKQELRLLKESNVDAYFHAGETLNAHTSQLYDALILGSRRLGHAYDLINHPVLLEKVKKDNVMVECCPISNQVLGYVSDMRNHNGRSMLNHGVKMCIASDDPAMFHYDDPTYDFALITKSWGLSLMKLKKLARQSFEGTCLDDAEIEQAQASFDTQWEEFVKCSLKAYGSLA